MWLYRIRARDSEGKVTDYFPGTSADNAMNDFLETYRYAPGAVVSIKMVGPYHRYPAL